MKTIKTEIIINASKEKVWKVLTDFENYNSWNPFIVSIKGKPIIGSQIITTMKLNNKTQIFKPSITKLDEHSYFEWVGKLPLSLFVGRHYFKITEANDGQVTLTHGEHFSGLLRGLIMKKIGDETYKSFVTMNQHLKKKAEES